MAGPLERGSTRSHRMILATKQDRNNFDEYSIMNNVQFQSNADIICVQCQNRLSFVEKEKKTTALEVQESDRDSFGMRE